MIVTYNIINFAGMALGVLDEDAVDIYTMNILVMDVNSFVIFTITVNSANRAFVTNAQSSKHTFKV